jgi:hypothetical protein
MQTIVFIDAQTNEVLGAVPIPECFAPNARFEEDAARIGVQGVVLEEEQFLPILDAVCDAGGSPEALFLNGVMLMQTMRAAQASLNITPRANPNLN